MAQAAQVLSAISVAVGLLVASLEPAGAQTTPGAGGETYLDNVQNQINGECPSSTSVPCIAGIVTSGGQVEVQNEGLAQYVVQQRLKKLHGEQTGGASADEIAGVSTGGGEQDASFFNGINVFFSGNYERKDKDANAFEAGFTSDKPGFTVGADKRLGDWGVAGLAVSYGHTFGEFDHNDGSFDTDSIGALAYASYYPSDQSFIDATVGFAYKFYDINRGFTMVGGAHQPVETHGDTTGVEFSTSLRGGYDWSFGAFTVGPRLGLNYIRTRYDAFSEDTHPLALSYGDQTEDSLTLTPGVQMSYAISTDFGVVVPQLNAEYVHEFLNDQHTVHAADTNVVPAVNLSYLTEKPDRNYAHVGVGVVFVLPEGYSPFLSYQAELFNSNEMVQTVTAGLRLELE